MAMLRPRFNTYAFIGSILIAGGVAIALYPLFPLAQYSVSHIGDTASPKPFAETHFLPISEPLPAALEPENNVGGGSAQQPANKTGGTSAQQNRIIIKKIDVDMAITEGGSSALERGSWRIPNSATPPSIGNTILTAHRYKYLPPSSRTFYLLDKLKIGDTFDVIWAGKTFRYGIDRRQITGANDLSVLKDTYDRRVTLLTCHPLFSTQQRLVVSGRLLR